MLGDNSGDCTPEERQHRLDICKTDSIMDHCRAQFNNRENWVSFGIAQTSQMLMGNAVRDNL